MSDLGYIWSNTDYPYQCLKDKVRTEAFRRAIHKVVKKGDTVIDVGAGSGILSFFAAEAGASKVYAVEIERFLTQELRRSIKFNNLEQVIEVVEGDIRKVSLPQNVNVLIAEIIDTGLVDELQVPALNNLKKRKIITEHTRLIPNHYKTFLELVYTDNNYYGYQITAPKHEWPFYLGKDKNWMQTMIVPVSEKRELVSTDFTVEEINEEVKETLVFNIQKGKVANAVRLSGKLRLCKGVELGATNALNGDKIISIDPIEGFDQVKIEVKFTMGNGLGNMRIEQIRNH